MFGLASGLGACANLVVLVVAVIILRVGRRLATGRPTRPGRRMLLVAALAALLGLLPRLVAGVLPGTSAAPATGGWSGPPPRRMVSRLAQVARFYDGALADPERYQASNWRIPPIVGPMFVLGMVTLLRRRPERRVAFAMGEWMALTLPLLAFVPALAGFRYALLMLVPLTLVLARFATLGAPQAVAVWALGILQAVLTVVMLHAQVVSP